MALGLSKPFTIIKKKRKKKRNLKVICIINSPITHVPPSHYAAPYKSSYHHISTNRTAECSISVYSFRRVFSAVSFLLVYPQFPLFKLHQPSLKIYTIYVKTITLNCVYQRFECDCQGQRGKNAVSLLVRPWLSFETCLYLSSIFHNVI